MRTLILCLLVLACSCKKTEQDYFEARDDRSSASSAAQSFEARVKVMLGERPTEVTCPLPSSDWRRRDCEGLLPSGPVTGTCYYQDDTGFLCHVRWDPRMKE